MMQIRDVILDAEYADVCAEGLLLLGGRQA